jgi:uncharacterized membrane protein
MFVIFWRGQGYLVLVASIIAFMLGSAIVDIAKLQQPLAGIAHTATQGLAGIALWLFARHRQSEPARVFIEKATGREIRVRRGAGSLFFVRTRYWAFILPALAAIVAVAQTLNPNH